MKKRHSSPIVSTLLVTGLLGIGALPALANNPLDDLAADAASGDTFSLTVNPYPAPGENDGNYYVGLTTGYLTDLSAAGNPQSDAFLMFCVDFNHDISTNPTAVYNVLIQGIATTPVPNNLNETLAQLQTQALLGADFGTSLPPLDDSQQAADVQVQHDIWNLDNPQPNPVFPGPDGGQLAAAETLLASNTVSFNDAYLFDILPPGVPGEVNSPGQAFMPVVPGGFNNSTQPPVPEPGTLAMLGLGLVGLGSLKLRRNRR